MSKTLAVIAVLTLTILVGSPPLATPALATCLPGERIDGSTANQAKRKFEQAGFRQLTDFHKGCDNYWHAIGTKDGVRSRVVLSPQGEIDREGD